MDLASSTRAATDRTRWKGIVVKSSMVPQGPPKVMEWTLLDKTRMMLSITEWKSPYLLHIIHIYVQSYLYSNSEFCCHIYRMLQ